VRTASCGSVAAARENAACLLNRKSKQVRRGSIYRHPASLIAFIDPIYKRELGQGGMEVAEKSIIIIGAGLAGLSAGCYGQMNGYRTQIFEMHTTPGGLCTAWKRKGYTFDGCIHWLTGSRSGVFHRFYEELGAVMSGRHVMQVICSKDKRPFVTTVP
jgi:hypothetical protein